MSTEIARGLRNRGLNVTTAADAGLLGASDEAHLAFARRTGRVIFTHDEDFLVLHHQGVEHAGILYSPLRKRTAKYLIRSLVLMNDIFESEEMMNEVEFL